MIVSVQISVIPNLLHQNWWILDQNCKIKKRLRIKLQKSWKCENVWRTSADFLNAERLPEALFLIFRLESQGAKVCFILFRLFCIIPLISIHFHYFIFNFGSFLPKDACKSDRSRPELSNEYLVANFVFFSEKDRT